MAAFLFSNNASTTLSAGVGTGDTTLNVVDGSDFPSPGAGQQFALTLYDALTGQLNEITYCTARSGNVLTVVRAQEGTAARAWAAGDFSANFVTAGTLAAFQQSGSLPIQPPYAADTGSTNSLVAAPSPAITAYSTGLSLLINVSHTNTGPASINVSGLGSKSIRDQSGAALTAGMLQAGQDIFIRYTAAGQFQLVPTLPGKQFISSAPAAAPVTASNIVLIDQGAGPVQTSISAVGNAITLSQSYLSVFYGMM